MSTQPLTLATIHIFPSFCEKRFLCYRPWLAVSMEPRLDAIPIVPLSQDHAQFVFRSCYRFRALNDKPGLSYSSMVEHHRSLMIANPLSIRNSSPKRITETASTNQNRVPFGSNPNSCHQHQHRGRWGSKWNSCRRLRSRGRWGSNRSSYHRHQNRRYWSSNRISCQCQQNRFRSPKQVLTPRILSHEGNQKLQCSMYERRTAGALNNKYAQDKVPSQRTYTLTKFSQYIFRRKEKCYNRSLDSPIWYYIC